MKIATFVLTIIGMVFTIFAQLINAFVFLSAGNPFSFLLCIIHVALAGVFGGFAIYYLNKNKKLIWVGVCELIFASLVGGILYLCWQEETETKNETVTVPYSENQENFTNKKDASEILVKLNKLYEDGVISKEEYEEKRKKYIDLL